MIISQAGAIEFALDQAFECREPEQKPRESRIPAKTKSRGEAGCLADRLAPRWLSLKRSLMERLI
jgi:hypothetical protein